MWFVYFVLVMTTVVSLSLFGWATYSNTIVVPDDVLLGAEVRAGVLERSNWTAAGRTGADGTVTLNTILPPADDAQRRRSKRQSAARAISPEPCAPLKLPRAEPIEIALQPAAPQEANTTPPPTGYAMIVRYLTPVGQ